MLSGYLLYLIHFQIPWQVDLKVPVVVRLEGTNVDQGKRILKVSAGYNSVVCTCWSCDSYQKHSWFIGDCNVCIAGKWNDTDHRRRSWWCGREGCKSIRQITLVYESEVSFLQDERCSFYGFRIRAEGVNCNLFEEGLFWLDFPC